MFDLLKHLQHSFFSCPLWTVRKMLMIFMFLNTDMCDKNKTNKQVVQNKDENSPVLL